MKEHPFSTSLIQYASRTNRRNPISSGNIDLLRNLNQIDLSARELSQLISNDPAITARVLRVANSSYYGIPNKISTISHATSLLGVDQVRTLVQSFCFSEIFQGIKPEDCLFDPRRFAAHSLVVSRLSARLARHFGFQMLGKGEAETAGLLHDIGKSVLATDQQPSSKKIREIYQRQEQPTEDGEPLPGSLLQAERDVLGFTHADLGAWLAVTWSLPEGVQEAIFYSHGSLEECFHKEWASVVTIANSLANTAGMSCLPTTSGEPIHESVVGFLKSQGKIGLYRILPDALLMEIESLKNLYVMVAEGPSSAAESSDQLAVESPLPPSEPLDQVFIPSLPETRSNQIPAWMEFFPGLTQMSRGQKILGGAWTVAFFTLLLSMVILGISEMWDWAAVSGLAAVLIWYASFLVT